MAPDPMTDLTDAIGQPLRVGQVVVWPSPMRVQVGLVSSCAGSLFQFDPCNGYPSGPLPCNSVIVIGSSVAEVDARCQSRKIVVDPSAYHPWPIFQEVGVVVMPDGSSVRRIVATD